MGAARGGSSDERIDVGVVVADPDAEVDVRDVVLGIAGRSRLGHGHSFDDGLATLDEQRA